MQRVAIIKPVVSREDYDIESYFRRCGFLKVKKKWKNFNISSLLLEINPLNPLRNARKDFVWNGTHFVG